MLENVAALYLQNKMPESVLPKTNISKEKIENVAQDLTSLCLGTVINPLFKGLKSEGGFSEELWRSVLIEHYGKLIASSPIGLGIKDSIKSEILRSQEKSNDERRSNNISVNNISGKFSAINKTRESVIKST